MRYVVLLMILGWLIMKGSMMMGQEMTVLVHDAQTDVERMGTLKDANATSVEKIA